MFGQSKREKRFSDLALKAMKHLKGLSFKDGEKGEKFLASSLARAERSAIFEILKGLGQELATLSGIEDTDQQRQEISDAYDLAKRATIRILDVSEIKSGKAHWFSYALKGLDEPEAAKPKLSKSWQAFFGDDDENEKSNAASVEDDTPVWLR